VLRALHRPGNLGIINFRFMLKHPPGAPPFNGPLSVEIEGPDGLHVGTLDTCTVTPNGSIRCH
jgi:hypothetical protein